MWKTGDTAVIRGVYQGRLCHAQSARVVRDSAEETILLVEPGAECVAPAGYLHHRHGDGSAWDRWKETLGNSLNIQTFTWHTNRFLILLEPEKYYSIIYIWKYDTCEFQYYYVNFQLPFTRTACGFDTLDLDLDILVDLNNEWEWKDISDYERGIKSGGISNEWRRRIEESKEEVLTRIAQRLYPFDQTWLGWLPDPGWPKTTLPSGWDQLDKG
jgi:protein associated with RNAse G/E